MIWIFPGHRILHNFAQILFHMSKINILSIIISSICLCGCSHKQGDTSDKSPCVFSFAPASVDTPSSTIHSSSVEEGKSVSVGFKTGGQIRHLTAHEGDYVKKGQVLGSLDDADYRLSLKQVETQYNQLTSEIKRIEEMYRRHNISENDYEKAVAGLEQLKLQLNLAKNNLDYTRLTAPISGHVVEKFLEEGEMVGAGTPVFKIVDNSSMEAIVALPASVYCNRAKIIRCIGKTSATRNEEIPLDMIGFIPDADSNSLFKLRLRIPDTYREILPGMSMSVEIFYSSDTKSDLKKIPSRSLFEKNGKSYVWEINLTDSTLKAREVRIVGVPEGKYSYVNGLDDASEIVAVGVHHLSENLKVNILGKESNIKDVAL